MAYGVLPYDGAGISVALCISCVSQMTLVCKENVNISCALGGRGWQRKKENVNIHPCLHRINQLSIFLLIYSFDLVY